MVRGSLGGCLAGSNRRVRREEGEGELGRGTLRKGDGDLYCDGGVGGRVKRSLERL